MDIPSALRTIPGYDESDDDIETSPQEGGLFNEVVRVKLLRSNTTWYLKQYTDKEVSTVFSPPRIPKEQRANLAYHSQKISRTQCEEAGDKLQHIEAATVYYDPKQTVLLVEGVPEPQEYIYELAKGELRPEVARDVGVILGRLHAFTLHNTGYTENKLYQNAKFKAFKLDLQYDQLAAHESIDQPIRDTVLEARKEYERHQLSLLHGDPNSRNIILSRDPTAKGGMIDFEQSHIGHPAYDIAYILSELYLSGMFHKKTAAMQSAIKELYEGYQSVLPFEKIPSMVEMITLHTYIQALYRMLGPSRDSWTYYMDDKTKRRLTHTVQEHIVKQIPLLKSIPPQSSD